MSEDVDSRLECPHCHNLVIPSIVADQQIVGAISTPIGNNSLIRPITKARYKHRCPKCGSEIITAEALSENRRLEEEDTYAVLCLILGIVIVVVIVRWCFLKFGQ